MTRPVFLLFLALIAGAAIAGAGPLFGAGITRAASCGGVDQEPCPGVEIGPTCDAWLRNSDGRCVPCGGVGEILCVVLKRGELCKAGLHPVRGRCVHVVCGGPDQVACPGLIHCDRGLVYSPSSRRCRKL